MLIKVLKRSGDTTKPDMIDMETTLKVGDKFKMEYDWCKRYPAMCGELREWYKDVCEFEVVDIVCNMLVNPHSVWIRLSTDDETFAKRCGGEEFDIVEEQALKRMVA